MACGRQGFQRLGAKTGEVAVEDAVEGVGEAALCGKTGLARFSVCARVARFCAAPSVGNTKAPFWPQAAKAEKTARKPAPTINFEFNIILILLAMTHALTNSEYLEQAETLLAAVEASCDRITDASDADLDNQRVGAMVTITFANKSQIIINLQKPLQEVWMATKAGGFHYKFDSGWRNTRAGSEFFSDLSQQASAQSGQAMTFATEINF